MVWIIISVVGFLLLLWTVTIEIKQLSRKVDMMRIILAEIVNRMDIKK